MTRSLWLSAGGVIRWAAVLGGAVLFGALGLACSEERGGEPGASTAAAEASVGAQQIASSSATATGTSSAAASSSSAPALPELAGEPPAGWGARKKWDGTFAEQNALLFDQLAYVHGIDGEQRRKLEQLFEASERVGQGNPTITKHPASPDECRAKLAAEKVSYRDPSFERICGARYMAPLYDPATQQPSDADSCIDQFEFPDIPCTFPVTWVRANEAVEICRTLGKRLCDAHEWEGACEGKLTPPDYNFGLLRRMNREDARRAMRRQHNIRIHDDRSWAYGPKYRKGVCGTASRKSKDCGVGWRKCGTNTFPTGHFPTCVSALGVYDQHGNAAEHMNLPLAPGEMASSPEQHYGDTEMKGSWFVFDQIRAHKDFCRWRAPSWHGTKVMGRGSHRNYHLGFRCCKSLKVP